MERIRKVTLNVKNGQLTDGSSRGIFIFLVDIPVGNTMT